MRVRSVLLAAGVATVLALPAGAGEEQAPKYGGTLTYLIPADAPPSFDAHQEETYATIFSAAPFYSLLVRINPQDPSSSTDIVCDLCTTMPTPTDGGKTWTFKIRQGVKFADGSPLSAADIVASWNEIIHPPQGILSPRQSHYVMIDTIEAPDPDTVVFHLKFATNAFLPALADPYSWVYEKKIIDKDPKWYMHNVDGTGPFKFVSYEAGQEIKGVKNPYYFHKGLPYLDGFTAIYAPKQAVQIDALRADRAAIEFRGYPPSAVQQLKQELDGKITIQRSDWNCGSIVEINEKKKPFDDVRVRRALTLAIDRWGTAPQLSKIAIVHTVGGIVFPGSPLAATKPELEQLVGYWPDIEKSRAEAKRLLKEAGAEGLSFTLLNRNVDQPYKYLGTWVIGDWSKIGLHVTQKVVPTGPWFQAYRTGNYQVGIIGNCQSVVNPLLDTQRYLPPDVNSGNYGQFTDPDEVAIYNKMLRETDFAKQRVLMRQYEKRVLSDQVHELFLLWWYRVVPYRSYVEGWKIGPSHYLNQDLSTIWLDKH
ncbi:MAG: ABC transporter substrate-binding protein [Stellaceae bacterium]